MIWAWMFVGALAYCSYSGLYKNLDWRFSSRFLKFSNALYSAWQRVSYYNSHPHTTKIDEVDVQEESGGKEKSAKDDKLNVFFGGKAPGNFSKKSIPTATLSKLMIYPAITRLEE